MAKNATPFFKDAALIKVGNLTTANTNLDGTGTIVDITASTTNGRLVERIRAVATGTTTAGLINLFIHDGVSWHYYDSLTVAAITVSATVAAWDAELIPSTELILPNGYKLGAAPTKSETFNVIAIGGTF